MEETRIEEKIKAAEAYLEIAKYLDSNPPIERVKGGVKAQKEARDRHRILSKVVCHFLYAIVLEITIKIMWELTNNRECKHTHNICKLYEEIDEKDQEKIRKFFDEKVSELDGLEGKMGSKKIKLGDLVEFASLEEALKSNEDTMKNFKYDNKFEGKTNVISSTIWNDETLWTLPSRYETFATKLFNDMKKRKRI